MTDRWGRPEDEERATLGLVALDDDDDLDEEDWDDEDDWDEDDEEDWDEEDDEDWDEWDDDEEEDTSARRSSRSTWS